MGCLRLEHGASVFGVSSGLVTGPGCGERASATGFLQPVGLFDAGFFLPAGLVDAVIRFVVQAPLRALMVVGLLRDFGQLFAVKRQERLVGKRSVIAAEFVRIDLHRVIISSIR